MSFDPPQFPASGATFQYGNIIWQFDGTAGVWNIVDGSLVGEQGPQGPAGAQGDRGPTGNTGNPSTGDSASITVSNGFITARLGAVGITGVLGVSDRLSVVNGIAIPLPASNGASGIASFQSGHFTVSGTGHVSLASTVTGDTVRQGVAINVVRGTNDVTINNMGVTSFNGLTGAVTYAPPIATINGQGNTGTRGLATFNETFFTVSNGAVGINDVTVVAEASFGENIPFYTVGSGTGKLTITGSSGIKTTVIGGGSPYFTVLNTGVTGIAVGNNDIGLTGRVQITAGANVTITTSGNQITIASSGGGGGGGAAAGITANPQQVLFSSGNGGTGSDNFVFNGLAATFGGANTQFTITGPTFNIGNNTVVRGGVFYDAAESAPYTDFNNSDIAIKASNGSVQRVRINRTTTATYSVNFDESVSGNWTDTFGVAESVVVILQSANGKTGGFGSGILLPSASTILGGVTGGIDVFTMMRIPYSGGSLKMAFPIARGMTAPNFSIGTQ